jgi:hypothetical protein
MRRPALPASYPPPLAAPYPVPQPTPTVADLGLDAIRSTGQRPYVLTGCLVGLLRQHFARPLALAEQALRGRDLGWAPDPADPTRTGAASGLVIESITRWDPALSGRRPAVVVRRDDFQYLSLGIDDRQMGWYAADGVDYFTGFFRGAHTLFCLDYEAGGAERLAAEVMGQLVELGPVFRVDLQLHRFKLAAVGALHRVEEAEGAYAVPVTVAYAYEQTWRLAQDAPKLKVIDWATLIVAGSL